MEILSNGRPGHVIGVAKDFNMTSLHEPVEPTIFFIDPNRYTTVLLRVRTDDLRATMAALEQTWTSMYPALPFAYRFTDEAFGALYRAEERLAQIFTVFAGLAILIACLGLFGLASFTAQARTKEIGVRKALGASVPHIVVMLSREIVILVVIAGLLAAPLSYLAMHRWLSGFAYHIDLSAWIFLAAVLAALGIALLTVSYQSVKAALANPVKSLRYE
jgi:putative ABC transport system permease protein